MHHVLLINRRTDQLKVIPKDTQPLENTLLVYLQIQQIHCDK